MEWNGWDLAFPIERWQGATWYGGHFGSGREPSSAVYDRFHNGRMHAGFDFGCNARTPLIAIADGEVVDVGYNSGAGNYVTLLHRAPWGTDYWFRALHIDWNGTLVTVGDTVPKGDTYALAGTTGASAANHLHAELTTAAPYVHHSENRHVDIEYVCFGIPGRKGTEMITAEQKALAALGYDVGVIDGIMGPKTEAAIAAHRADALKAGGQTDHRHRNTPPWKKLGGWVGKWAE
jgi:murein DD-endopeptidase MepM/ murein hydrolase activator NlpD